MRFLRVSMLLLATSFAAVSVSSWAQPTVSAAESKAKATLELSVILASPTAGPIDEKAARYQKQLTDMGLSFASYKSLSENTVSLGANTTESFSVAGNRVVEITPLKIEANGKIQAQIIIKSEKGGKLVDAVYEISPGKDLIVGGLKQDDGRLFIAVHHVK